MVLPLVLPFDWPVIFVLFETVQVYVVLAGTISDPEFVGVIVNALPLQIVCNLLAITGLEFKFTLIVKTSPVQDPADELGVSVYVAVC
jgi:hypothetical protein